MIKRPAFLVLPAYIVGVAAVFALHSLVPGAVGAALAAVLVLCMATAVSLFHSRGSFDLAFDGAIWLVVLVICSVFALQFIPAEFGSHANDKFTWWQVAFLVTQQAFYFGIHAFGRE